MKFAAMVLLALLVILGAQAEAQVTGEPGGSVPQTTPGRPSIPDDTLFIFEPARPLIDSLGISAEYDDAMGIDILFSNSGFGGGGFYQHNYSQKLAGFVNIGLTGSRSRDEFEEYDSNEQDWLVPGKVNRLYTIPLTVGLRYRLLENVIVDNFRPYMNIGAGPTMIVALPYAYGFFKSFAHARAYFTGGGFIGVGAEIGGSKPVLGVNLRYFYIPLRPGLESVQGDPITNFGGLFLTMNIGFAR